MTAVPDSPVPGDAVASHHLPGDIAPGPVRRRRPRAPWIVLVALLTGLALVWALGGFRGGALLVPVKPGDTLELGPMDFVALDARAAHSAYGNDWTVQVHGTCTATDPGGVDPDIFNDDEVVMADAGPREHRVFAEDFSVELRFDTDREATLQRTALDPGLGAMPCAFQAHMPDSFKPESGLLFGLALMDFRDASVTGNQDPVWTPGQKTYRLELPVIEVAQL